MNHKVDPKIGEKVWIKPANPDVPVPFETTLRGGLFSGQRGHTRFPPSANKVLSHHRVHKLREPAEVEWSVWWARRWVQGDIELCNPPTPAKAKEKKSGGDK